MSQLDDEVKRLSEKQGDRVFTLATGALALSIAFRESIAARAIDLPLLNVAWVSFVLCILAHVASTTYEANALIDRQKSIAKTLKEHERITIVGLSILTSMGFIMGIIFLTWFAIANNGPRPTG